MPKNAIMPTTCAIYKCHSRSGRDKKSFYRIPKVITGQGEEAQKKSERRRRLWLAAINRSDVKPCDQLRVCSDHFISGKPNLYYETSPDWVPSMNLGYETEKSPTASAVRYERLKNRKAAVKANETAAIKAKEAAMSLLELKVTLPGHMLPTSTRVSEPEPESSRDDYSKGMLNFVDQETETSNKRKLELANIEISKLKEENLKLRMKTECLRSIVRKLQANMPDT